jgi:hypothetical protein
MNIPDPGLENVGNELLEGEYETDIATDPRVPSMEWENTQGLYKLKVYSEEFLENDSKAVGGKTLEDIVKKQASEENDFYIEVAAPTDSFRPEREVYTFSEDEIEQGLREVIERYAGEYEKV